jgi:hypothetical protein
MTLARPVFTLKSAQLYCRVDCLAPTAIVSGAHHPYFQISPGACAAAIRRRRWAMDQRLGLATALQSPGRKRPSGGTCRPEKQGGRRHDG